MKISPRIFFFQGEASKINSLIQQSKASSRKGRSLTTLNVGLATALCFLVAASSVPAGEFTLDDIFPTDRVLDVQITVTDKNWDIICHQAREFFPTLGESRQFRPIEIHYPQAFHTISGRKKK